VLSEAINSKILSDVVQTEARLASHVRRVVCCVERYFEAAHICGVGRQGFGNPCVFGLARRVRDEVWDFP